MGRIIVTIAGPWSNPPPLRSRLELYFGPGEEAFTTDVAALGRRQEALSTADIRALRGHAGLVQGVVDFDEPGSTAYAEAAARLMLDAFEAGALAIFVETGMRVFGPGALRGLSPGDPASLLHTFVGVFAEEDGARTEGLCAFDLPEVVVRHPEDRAAAQAAAFGLAARMVCDGLRLEAGAAYTNTLSAPTYRIGVFEAEPEEDPDNSRGHLLLEPT